MKMSFALLAMFAMCAAHGECDVLLAEGWRFAKDATQIADWSAEALDDSEWERVQVPHDWAIGGPFLKNEPSGETGRLPWKGVGWYRLSFDISPADAGKCVFLDFDGAMAAPEVYVNGQKAGGWDYGYASFRVDATPFVRAGSNKLAVRLSTLHMAARWYPGAGLYRRVMLRVRDKAHFVHDGVFVTTPEVGRDRAFVKVAWETEGAVKGSSVTVRIVREKEFAGTHPCHHEYGRTCASSAAFQPVALAICSFNPALLRRIDVSRQFGECREIKEL